MAHARFSASGYARWGTCPGSVALAAKAPPRQSSEFAQEGTDAHGLGETALRSGIRRATQAWPFSPLAARPVHRGMCEAVQDYLDYVYRILDEHPDAQMLVEQRFDLPTTNAPGEAWGTADCVIYLPSANLLYVIDYKHGAGVAVDAEGNKQLQFYGAGVVFGALDVVPDRIILTVVQPRAFHAAGPIREWEVAFDDLLSFTATLDDDIERCLEDVPLLVPGEQQCRWCPAATTCPALESKALQAVNTNFASVKDIRADMLPNVRDLPADKLAMLLDAKKLLDVLFKEAEEYAFELARLGHTIPGKKLVETQERRKWFGDEEYIAETLCLLTGADIDDVYPRKLITITKAEDKVVKVFKENAKRKDANKAAEDARKAMAFLTLKQGSGSVTLVDDSDPRPPIDIAHQNFTNVSLPSQ